MEKKNRVEIDMKALENVAGGSLGYDPDDHGTYTMNCQYSGNVYYDIPLSDVMEICKFSANIPDTPEGEEEILSWARDRGIIS